jgi:L-ascorbate metabolism protein UlaG (beta-lactamase superfamily)
MLITILLGIVAGSSMGTINPSLILATDNVPGEVSILKYPGGYTCFLIKSPAGVRIISDPCGMDETIQPDIVTESHNHGDHSDLSMITKPYKLFTTAGEFSEKGIKITGIAGHHNRGDSWVTNVMYIFDIDGIRIAEFGSQGDMPDQAALKKMGTVDLLIIQLFANTTDKLTLKESLAIVKSLGAKIIVPAHCDDSPATFNRFAQSLGSNDVTYIKSGKLTLTRAELDKIKIPKVVVLNR